MNCIDYNRKKRVNERQMGMLSNFCVAKPLEKEFLNLMRECFLLVINYILLKQQRSRLESQSPFTLHASPFTTNYFYFLNAHGNVTYFSDANFTPEKIESYEYSPWGVLLTFFSKNNYLFLSLYFDYETNLIFQHGDFFNPDIASYSNPPRINPFDIILRYFFGGNKTALFFASAPGGGAETKDSKYCKYNVTGGNCKVVGRGCPSPQNKANPCVLTSGGPGAGYCECRDPIK